MEVLKPLRTVQNTQKLTTFTLSSWKRFAEGVSHFVNIMNVEELNLAVLVKTRILIAFPSELLSKRIHFRPSIYDF